MSERKRHWEDHLLYLQRIREQLDRGEPLTEDQAADLMDIFNEMVVIIKPIADAFYEAFGRVAEAFANWYDELPEQAKNDIQTATDHYRLRQKFAPSLNDATTAIFAGGGTVEDVRRMNKDLLNIDIRVADGLYDFDPETSIALNRNRNTNKNGETS